MDRYKLSELKRIAEECRDWSRNTHSLLAANVTGDPRGELIAEAILTMNNLGHVVAELIEVMERS